MLNSGKRILYRVFRYGSDGRYNEVPTPPGMKGFGFAEVFNVVNREIDSGEFADGTYIRLIVTDTEDHCHLDYVVGKGVIYPTYESDLMSRNLSHICSME